ncbi:hypothetical protein AAA799O18_00435 [Marine Group I thaumarchaeote SCGC AAA799-O18]|nr:hypothetical protein AAA799O18_00435 [Marine Group I thaumarchaeote SCGC AAA799-O18]
MILKRFSIVIFLVSVIAVGSLAPAFASSQLEVTIDPNSDTAVAKMTYQRSIVIDYSEGGKVAEVMNGKSDKLEFTASSSTTGMNSLIAKLNSYVASKGSQARITDLDLDYLVSFTGRTGNASLDYKIVLTPVIQDFVIKAGDGNSPTLIDIDWRGFGALGPVVISTLMHGDVEINLPISAIEGFFPALGLSMKSSEASELLTERLMNGDGIKDQPVGNWHFLFDPTGIGVDAAQHGFSTGSVLSSFTMGESSIREGLIREQVSETTFTSDKVYIIKSIESSANASIDIIGFANRDTLGSSEIFGVTPQAPEGYASTSSGEFPAFILYGMAGMAAIGGVAMMMMSKRKLSKEKGHYQQTGIDPSQLTGVQTSASAGGYQTVRGEAQVKGLEDYNQHRNYYNEEKPQVEEKTEDKPSSKRGALPKGFKPKE